jgi:hypothetical protein
MAATKAKTTLKNVEISLSSGKGTLEGFKLGNPEGFTTDSAMAFGKIDVELNTKSVMSDGPIIIHYVLIDAPEITYEVAKDGSSNLQRIMENIEAFTASALGGRKQDSSPAAAQEPEESDTRKMIIEKLVINDGRVRLSHALLEGKKLVDAALPISGKFAWGYRQADPEQDNRQGDRSWPVEHGQRTARNGRECAEGRR